MTLPIIGMSPGNSYFKNREVAHLLKETIKRYSKVAIMVLDEPATSTYLAMGYSLEKASKKARLQGNGLKNKTKSVLECMGIDSTCVIIIDRVNDIAQNNKYLIEFDKIIALYGSNLEFKTVVQNTSREVLDNNGKEYSEFQLEQATHYLLSEIAFLAFASSYFNVKKIDYVYHKPRRIFEDYIAGIFDGVIKHNLDFILLEAPYETYTSLTEQESTRLEIIQRRGSLKCAYAPYTKGLLHLDHDGSLSGLFYDVMNIVSSINNLTLEFIEQSGYGVIAQRLNHGFTDVFCAPVRPTQSRRLELFFSKSIISSKIYAYVHKDSRFCNIDLIRLQESDEIRIVANENDIHHDIAQKYFPKARIVRLTQLAAIGQEIQYILDNRADIAFWEDTLVDQYLGERNINSNTLMQKGRGNKPVEIYDNCIALPRGEFELKDMIDNAIDALVK